MPRPPANVVHMVCIIAACSGLQLLAISCRDKKTNHLSNASSPYLRAQSGDPVDWREWGDETLLTAKKENKPLLISIGYSSCHWCHMMEKESFMDTAVARIMNENFICIKVDREERPDIDNVYTNACQLIAGSSGWPLNAFALPDGKPFFAGTYYSRQSWMNLLRQIITAYNTQKGKVDLQAKSLSNGIAGLEFSVLADSVADSGNKAAFANKAALADKADFEDKAGYRQIFEGLYKKMDLSFGGLKGEPKFPLPSSIDFLLQYHALTNDKRALDAAITTLTEMALGGIYDQIGGGFARYSVDSLWHIPHFEKMLYDNAELLSVYAHAYQLTRNDLFKRIMQETTGFIRRDLANAGGGYFCSLDADSREGEGEFYTWSFSGIRSTVPGNYKLIADYYHVTEDGNWKPDKNVLFAGQTPVEFARSNGIDPHSFSVQLAAAQQSMRSERNRRPKPTVDDKILTSWNAELMIGYLDAYAALGDDAYLQNALGIARFLEKNIIGEAGPNGKDRAEGAGKTGGKDGADRAGGPNEKDGKLWRLYKDGKASVTGFLDDYALLAKAYIRLYELTFDKSWLDRARQLTSYAIRDFYDPVSGMFFYTAYHADTSVIRKIGLTDNDLPSSNATMADVLYALGVYFEDDDYLNKSARMVSRVYGQLHKEGAAYYASWCLLPGLLSYGSKEVAILGKDARAKGLELQKTYLPGCLFMGSAAKEDLPLLQGKISAAKTLIYICSNKTCQRPVEGIADALIRLKK
jgi:uncharacterized protein